MKKLLITLALIGSSSIFAMSTVNLDNANYSCNNLKLNSKITISTITMNCKNAKVIIHAEPSGGMYANREPGGGAEMTMTQSADDETQLDKVLFNTDKGTYMKCYFNNNKLIKCKAKSTSITKLKPNASSESSSK